MIVKNCKKCGFSKNENEFCKGRKVCKLCYSIRNKEYYTLNKEDINSKRWDREKDKISKLSTIEHDTYKYLKNEIVKKCRENNPGQSKEYYILNSDRIKLSVSEYRSKNRDIINLNFKNRYKNDSIFRLSTNIRNLIRSSIHSNNYIKKSKTQDILGCSFEEFKLHLESKFEHWMTWENYGMYNGEIGHGWDIDHIIPSSSAITEYDVFLLNHYTNLQPLCSKVNRDIKRNIITTNEVSK